MRASVSRYWNRQQRNRSVACLHCGARVYLNLTTRRWVTRDDEWKCGSDDDNSCRAHNPNKEEI